MAKDEKTYDVLVVGAGPAGSTAAGRCAELGLRTLLFDRRAFPRPKACGGGLTRAAQTILGDHLPAKTVETECDRLIADFGGRRLEARMPRPFMATVRRESFDLALVEAATSAGAEFRPGVEVATLEEDPTSKTLAVHLLNSATGRSTPARASVLIAADGVMGRVSRILAGPLRQADLAFCLVGEAEPDGEVRTPLRPDTIQCFYGLVGAGYGWIFPLKDGYNVGLGAPAPEAAKVAARWTVFLQENSLRLRRKATGAFVPVGGPRRALAGRRWALAGDAAGLADPFSGEGIRYAMSSGLLAAESAAHYLDGGPELSRSYPRLLHRSCAGDLRVACRVQRLVARRPAVMERLFFGSGDPFRQMLGILDGTTTYRDLIKQLLPVLPGAYLRGALRVRP